MGKTVTTRWYIGAWIVAVISAIVFFMTAHVQTSPGGTSAISTSPIATLAWIAAGISGLVMLVAWIVTLVHLAQLRRWGWFTAMLVLQLAWLGIIPVVAYAWSGSVEEERAAVTRPSVT